MTHVLLSFDEYKDRYPIARMRREDGILEVTFHSKGDSLRWNMDTHHQFAMVLACIAADRENRIVILTGTGKAWSGPRVAKETISHRDPDGWQHIIYYGRQLQMNMLGIEVPVIFALNGPPYRHSELPLLADIVLASEDSIFEDTGHFHTGDLVPGDGIYAVYSALVGPNRARYMHLMGTHFTAQQALAWGLVGEILPGDKTLARAWDIARLLATKSDSLLRHTRMVLTQPLKERMLRHLGHGLALEVSTVLSQNPPTRPLK